MITSTSRLLSLSFSQRRRRRIFPRFQQSSSAFPLRGSGDFRSARLPALPVATRVGQAPSAFYRSYGVLNIAGLTIEWK